MFIIYLYYKYACGRIKVRIFIYYNEKCSQATDTNVTLSINMQC